MSVIVRIAEPAIKAVARLGSALTYDYVPCKVADRADNRGYLGHVPFFVAKDAGEKS